MEPIMTDRGGATAADLMEIISTMVLPYAHRQRYRSGWSRSNRTGPVIREHVTSHESLIQQLRNAITDRAGVSGGSQAAYRSVPKFSSDAFDRMEAIRTAVSGWHEKFELKSAANRSAEQLAIQLDFIQQIIDSSRIKSPAAQNAISALREIVGMVREAVEPDLLQLAEHAAGLQGAAPSLLAGEARRWRTWCLVMTGWQDPPLRPYVPCPHCEALPGDRAGLRVRIDAASGSGGVLGDASVKAAVCLSCDATWDADTIGLLAEHIRLNDIVAQIVTQSEPAGP